MAYSMAYFPRIGGGPAYGSPCGSVRDLALLGGECLAVSGNYCLLTNRRHPPLHHNIFSVGDVNAILTAYATSQNIKNNVPLRQKRQLWLFLSGVYILGVHRVVKFTIRPDAR
ncbi:uncharacterized protein LOC123518716 [Portunus trituberculatus]|uniref:uncharacterized protein LOC123518716 n=1 Tax=Portunus trituberculatus TaxID=210409 RepID=UPI001E1CF135|nr:uncharacterized protein LOC123518716 [Portunus trituberculatus]